MNELEVKIIEFKCYGENGTIDHNGSVRWSGIWFHLENVNFNHDSALVKVLTNVLDGSSFESYVTGKRPKKG